MSASSLILIFASLLFETGEAANNSRAAPRVYPPRGRQRMPIISMRLDPQQALNTNLRVAARQNSLRALKDFLKDGAQIDSRSDRGETALMNASRSCSSRIVRYLLKQGADPNLRSKRGRTALIFAARNSCVPVVVELLKVRTLDLTARDHRGKTALDYARETGVTEVGGPSAKIVKLIQASGKAR